MLVITLLALTHIGAFVAGAFAHRWLAKETLKIVQPVANAAVNGQN